MLIPSNDAKLPEGPALYVVATPIGNLEDITFRALRVLSQCDRILSEDTRKTGILLKHYGIDTPQKSYRVHRREQDDSAAMNWLSEGQNLAFCSDAGTPGISDPVSHLVRRIRADEAGDVIPIPGPSALATALSVTRWQSHTALCGGFLRPKSARRRRFLETEGQREGAIVLYESVHRIEALLRDIREILPGRSIFIARELTKVYEECLILEGDLPDEEWEEKLSQLKK